MNPTLVLDQTGIVFATVEAVQPQFVNLVSADGSAWLSVVATTKGTTWVPKDTPGASVNWVKLASGYYRCSPQWPNVLAPISVVKILGPAPTPQG